MDKISAIFGRLEALLYQEGQNEFMSVLCKDLYVNIDKTENKFTLLKTFLQKNYNEINELSAEIRKDDTILISVQNQKFLRTSFQLIATLGISHCLIPGLGISLSKKCSSASILPLIKLTDEQKYEILIESTDFFTRSYEIPVLKKIIITLHLSDYLAALIQLAFAPLKKPGTYGDFIMTEELYDKISLDKQKYVQVYEHLVCNCFQPLLMKELLVLQSGTEPSPPMFVKKIVSKEMSRRLLAPGGLLSLIRCFIESYNIDTGFEWKKIDTICKIVGTKHGSNTEEEYVNKISLQITQILSSNNTHYLATAVACILFLHQKYTQSVSINKIVNEIFQSFDYAHIKAKCDLPGTIILSPQEIEHKINILHACVCTTKLDCPVKLLQPNLFLLFALGAKCTKSYEYQTKLTDIITKCLCELNKEQLKHTIKELLFGKIDLHQYKIVIVEFDAGLAIKCGTEESTYQKNEAVIYLLRLAKAALSEEMVGNIFDALLQILIDVNVQRRNKSNQQLLHTVDEDPVIVTDTDENYAHLLQLLSEMSTIPKVISSINTNPATVLSFIEHFLLKTRSSNDECVTIALVLLNTILSNSKRIKDLQRYDNLIPVLRKMSGDDADINSILCTEALALLCTEGPQKETAYSKAVNDVFDKLLPVRAHGIMQLTKLIDAKDPETISKKHYIFCLFQEQLKDSDSYIYLSAINGIASLGTHCTDDVLHVLCKEFLEVSTEQKQIATKENQNKMSELKMKIGDIIVKVTRSLGDMAVLHKTVLLNTMLCGCRDEDPLIRTSALSNLAEIALILHYKVGTIIYELLLCIWSIIETDKAIECRRAAVMVITSLLKGLGKETLVQLKENLLPIYRTLKNLYRDPSEDSVVRLHAQLALEELNDSVKEFLFPELKMEKEIFILGTPENHFK